MSGNQDINITDLFKKIKDRLFILSITQKIEYLDYKKSIYIPESTKTAYEEAFHYFPYDEVKAFDKIQIFIQFYTIDVWGSIGPMERGDEKYNYSIHEIANRINEPKSNYIFTKLKEKYANIAADIPAALNGYKKSEKLTDDHPEKNVLINLLNRYRKVLANDDLQLGIFNNLFLNKYISDVFTEILINLIQRRLRLLEPKIIKYKRPPDKKVLIEEFEEEETIPLIKLNYNPDQQKQILGLLYKRLFPEYIDDSYEQFESHFMESDIEFSQIIWKGTEREIAHLFKSLKDMKIVLSQDQNKLIEIHFLNRNENPFKSKQLRVAYTKSPIETFSTIHQLILTVKKLTLAFN